MKQTVVPKKNGTTSANDAIVPVKTTIVTVA